MRLCLQPNCYFPEFLVTGHNYSHPRSHHSAVSHYSSQNKLDAFKMEGTQSCFLFHCSLLPSSLLQHFPKSSLVQSTYPDVYPLRSYTHQSTKPCLLHSLPSSQVHCGIRLTDDATWEVRQTNFSHSVRAVTLIYTSSSKSQQGHSQPIARELKGNSLWATAQNTDRKGPWQSKVQTGTDSVCVSNLRQSAEYQRMLTGKCWGASEKFALEVMKYTYTQFI